VSIQEDEVQVTPKINCNAIESSGSILTTTGKIKAGESGEEIWLGWGSGGDNRGVYDTRTGKWLVYLDANDNARTQVSSYMEDLDEKSSVDDYTLLQLRGWGGVFMFNMASVELSNALASGSTVKICKIPSGYRPKHSVYGPLACFGHDVGSSYVRIKYDGDVEIVNASSSAISAGWKLGTTITYVS
jgi:hypothetical protein